MRKYKEIWKMVLFCFILFIPFWSLMYFLHNKEMWYMDDEFAAWKQNKDIINSNIYGKEYFRYIILGDSRANGAFQPELLSDDTYNLALGGATPIEMYYTMQTYLESHNAPEKIFIAFGDYHIMAMDCFWGRTMYFNQFSDKQVTEVFNTAKQFQEKTIYNDNYWKDWLCYRWKLPNKYIPALLNSAFVGRKEENETIYAQTINSRGRYIIPNNEYSDGLAQESLFSEFIECKLLTFYYKQLIELLIENKIEVHIERIPYNENTFQAIPDLMKEQIKDYYEKLKYDYPEITVNSEIMMYENDNFGDAGHLNKIGSKKYSEYIKEKYLE